jgi:hypothetical protein
VRIWVMAISLRLSRRSGWERPWRMSTGLGDGVLAPGRCPRLARDAPLGLGDGALVPGRCPGWCGMPRWGWGTVCWSQGVALGWCGAPRWGWKRTGRQHRRCVLCQPGATPRVFGPPPRPSPEGAAYSQR